MVTTGVNSNSFTWGTGVSSPSSSLKFIGTGFASVLPEQAFSLGSLSYFNGTVLDGTQCPLRGIADEASVYVSGRTH